ncbi:MAG: stage II sporulation protein R [Oscillospiraceae bacterium]|jgi:stage II sporulation protein R|nr:stage II sporulation protein R [Oscillospiraceae bacterium]
MKFKKWETALIAALAVTFFAGAALASQQQELSGTLIRLHVVANSDSTEDQAAKLAARDGVLSELDALLEGVSDREHASKLISQSMGAIESAAHRAAGGGYSVHAELKPEYFPTREYETFSLPAGRYMSLRVVLGDGDGRNWWCVVFPPLCAPAADAASAGAPLAGEHSSPLLTDEEIALISESSAGVTVKFKAMEIIGRIRATLGI